MFSHQPSKDFATAAAQNVKPKTEVGVKPYD